MLAVCPAPTVPMAQGNAPVQAPVVDTNVRPAGVALATLTPCASLGPLLVTEIVRTRFVPRATVAGPVMVSATSAVPEATIVDIEAVLLPAAGSAVDVVTVAVLVIGFGPA